MGRFGLRPIQTGFEPNLSWSKPFGLVKSWPKPNPLVSGLGVPNRVQTIPNWLRWLAFSLVWNWFKLALNQVWTKLNHWDQVWTVSLLSQNQKYWPNLVQTGFELGLNWTKWFIEWFMIKMIINWYLTHFLTVLIDLFFETKLINSEIYFLIFNRFEPILNGLEPF